MKLRTFTANSMAAALAVVKREMGPGAVILHTRSFKQGGIMGFGAKQRVEITAADGCEVARRKRKEQDDKRRAALVEMKAAKKKEPQAVQQQTAGDLIRKTYAVAKAEIEQQNVEAAQTAATVKPPSIDEIKPVPVSHSSEQLASELDVVKRMVAQMQRQMREQANASAEKGNGKARHTSGFMDLPDKLFDQYMGLLKQEVSEDLAEEVIRKVRGKLGPRQVMDEEKVRTAVTQEVAKYIPVDSKLDIEATDDGRPRTIALVGPTGVGKTTTVAKLAANFKLKQKKRVGLITLDTYRIAAVDQLRTYANIIGVPLHVVTSTTEMIEAIDQCNDCDVVLIDTVGRSQRDDPKLEQLAEVVSAAQPHEVHLVLSSTCTQSALLDVIEKFSKIHIDRMIFTKLDEAVTFGVLLNVARKVDKKLSFVTTGQEVPHHIEAGHSDRLAELVCGVASVF